jgi:hypothetical protein
MIDFKVVNSLVSWSAILFVEGIQLTGLIHEPALEDYERPGY